MPTKGYTVGGFCPLGRYRIRPSLFGSVVEELIQHSDGSQTWRKITWPVEIRTGSGTEPPFGRTE